MDLNVHESRETDAHQVEPGDLLEECWFFGNLLRRKPRMLRSFSDPCTSFDYSQENLPGKSYEETYAAIKNEEARRPGPGPGGRQSLLERQGGDPRKSKPDGKASGNRLVRAPSLPTSLEKEEFHDEENEFSMGKLIRLASMNHRDNLPPRLHSANKGVTPSSSVSRQRSRRKSEAESMKLEGLEAIKPQPTGNQAKTQKSRSAVDFKDLTESGFDLERRNLSPDVVSIENEEKMARRAAWGVPPPPPPLASGSVSKVGGKRSNEDMKAQIKFWARAVASNVRQEC
ncbi:hypothetical protein Sango_2580700 [Sesamum angolense]|uniref:Uncharacterized protein n=1 Tax=Sesamum angolense TaxID=2727404 RepID=A0AAE1W5G4_9LAMI|nr:hypothetical protein Sango_2580700 [Sesamum angolense]